MATARDISGLSELTLSNYETTDSPLNLFAKVPIEQFIEGGSEIFCGPFTR